MEQEGGLIEQIRTSLEAELSKNPNPRAGSSAAASIALLRSLLAKAGTPPGGKSERSGK